LNLKEQTMTDMSDKAAKVLRFAAIYDIAFTAILMIPPLVPIVLGIIAAMDAGLGFGTVFTPLDATSVFFINLGAASVTAWGAIRIVQPNTDSLIVDVLFRGVLILTQIWAVASGATPILLGISAVLLLIAAAELNVLRGERKTVNTTQI
jgi:hypothetical protein